MIFYETNPRALYLIEPETKTDERGFFTRAFCRKGFAHSFQALTDDCDDQYFMSEFYALEHATDIRRDDPFLAISLPIKNPTLSQKDKNWSAISD